MEASHNWWWSRFELCRSKDLGVRLPPLPRKHSDIAQLVEQFIRNEPVARSSRAVGAIWRGSLIGKTGEC